MNVAVILGLGCNFACPYCYEGDKGAQAMFEATGEALIDHDEFVVGDVWNGFGKDVPSIFGGPRWKSVDRCRDCLYLPLCFGGCRYMRYQRTGTMTGVECQKAFLDATLEPMIRQEVRYRWGAAATTRKRNG